MRESLLTIPINEVFEPNEEGEICGCPFCKMRNTVEQHICEYIMGAAMMEPDVRLETNKLGFCHRHFLDLLKQSNRLSLGLMLNSYLSGVRKDIFAKKGLLSALKPDKRTKKAAQIEETCFVCSKVNWGMEHMVKTFFVMFKDDSQTAPKFRPLLQSQEFICMPHYAWIREKAHSALDKSTLPVFLNVLDELVGNYIETLNVDVDGFCNSFDYRNAGKLHTKEMEHVRTSVNRSITFLTGREVE
ncbi:MAG: DUF6062 family protein [Oscillospiraceae bacterium]|nr:DUF6062 family protein [Oscillospiraceae bacterium]